MAATNQPAPQLTPRAYVILSVLNDLKDAFLVLLEGRSKHPALLVMYAFIDICAAISRDVAPATNQKVFVRYLEEFLTPGMRRAMPPKQLWAARSALLHAFSPLGHQTGPGKSKPTFYYSWREDEDKVRAALGTRGYSDFSLLSLNDVKTVAIWCYNGMITRMDDDPAFRQRVLENGQHLLLDYDTMVIESFLVELDQDQELVT